MKNIEKRNMNKNRIKEKRIKKNQEIRIKRMRKYDFYC